MAGDLAIYFWHSEKQFPAFRVLTSIHNTCSDLMYMESETDSDILNIKVCLKTLNPLLEANQKSQDPNSKLWNMSCTDMSMLSWLSFSFHSLLSICHQNYFQTSKGHVTWVILKVNRIPSHCNVAYESVCSFARGYVIRVCFHSNPRGACTIEQETENVSSKLWRCACFVHILLAFYKVFNQIKSYIFHHWCYLPWWLYLWLDALMHTYCDPPNKIILKEQISSCQLVVHSTTIEPSCHNCVWSILGSDQYTILEEIPQHCPDKGHHAINNHNISNFSAMLHLASHIRTCVNV